MPLGMILFMETNQGEANLLTNSLFFDNDCLSAFLWTEKQNILTKLYSNRIIIPRPVYVEIDRPSISHLKRRLDEMIENEGVIVKDIDVGTSEFDLYYELTESLESEYRLIGKGEASTIALAKEKNGIVASNNLRDISRYVNMFNLKHITTGGVLIEALDNGFISESDGNNIWSEMLAKRRRLGASSFTDLSLRKPLP